MNGAAAAGGLDLRGADGDALALALALTLAPLALGAAGGMALAAVRRAGVRRLVLAAALALPLAAFALPPGALWGIGTWDLCFLAALAALGVLLGDRLARGAGGRGEALLAAGGLALALAVLEGGSRLLLPAPPAFPPPREARFLATMDHAGSLSEPRLQEALFPGQFPGLLERHREQSAGRARRVLHVGDSMVAGGPLAEDLAFPRRLGDLDPGTAHLNAGMSGTSLDFQVRVVREWLDRLPPDAVVLYPYYNDLGELDRPYAACGDGPLVDWSGGAPRDACPRSWSESPAEHPRLSSPPPLALRVLTPWSAFARHACAAMLLRMAPPFPGFEESARRYGVLLASLRDLLAARGIPLALVLPPSRGLAEGGPASEVGARSVDVARRFQAVAEGAGLALLDAGPAFREALQADPGRRLFVDDPPGDPHLSDEGHRRMAAWLLQALSERDPPLAGPGARPVTR